MPTHKTLRFDLIKEMVNNYRDNQLQSILDSADRPMDEDAHSIWFDFDALKAFMADIELLVANNTNTVAGKLGIRMYYAAYPAKEKWSTHGYEDLAGLQTDPITRRYEKKHTLIMIPTNEVDGENIDFNPMDAATYGKDGNEAKLFGRTIALTGTAASSPALAMNHGFIIPPKSSFGEWF